jgi:streptomycin 6-kinase
VADLLIPRRLAETAVLWEGDRGRAWVADLPRLVAEVCEVWQLELEPPLEPGGQISWVAPARDLVDGLDAVLKLQCPHPESEPEAAGLLAWGGNGAVRLLDHDPVRHALLLERCWPGTGLQLLAGSDEAMRVGAAVGARLHETDAPMGLRTLAAVLDDWADELDVRLARPFAGAALDTLALDTMRHRPRACGPGVLLHGDLNPTNVLAAEREPWLAIDPKPMTGDPAYDGPRLVTQPDPLATADPAATLARRLDIVGDVMGVDRDALALWCLVGAVEMGASARSHGDLPAAANHARVAELVDGELP